MINLRIDRLFCCLWKTLKLGSCFWHKFKKDTLLIKKNWSMTNISILASGQMYQYRPACCGYQPIWKRFGFKEHSAENTSLTLWQYSLLLNYKRSCQLYKLLYVFDKKHNTPKKLYPDVLLPHIGISSKDGTSAKCQKKNPSPFSSTCMDS